MNNLTLQKPTDLNGSWNRALASALADLNPSTAKRYRQRLERFKSFMQGRELNKVALADFKKYLALEGSSPATVNAHLSAIRRLLDELVEMGVIPAVTAWRLSGIRGARNKGVRLGRWLTPSQAQQLLQAPDRKVLRGTRDVAILATLLFTGLRRQELCSLQIKHIRQIDAHWAIVNLIGKGGKVRTVKLPAAVKRIIDAWLVASGRVLNPESFVFVAMKKGGKIDGESLSAQGVYNIVKKYAEQIGVEISAHDLRRSFARMAYDNGADLGQLSLRLGHESVQTTEKYIGVRLNLDDDPSDYIKLKL